MPLTQAEVTHLNQILMRSGLLENAPAGGGADGGLASTVIAALTSLTNVLTRIEIIMESAGATDATEATATPEVTNAGERKPRGRPAKQKVETKLSTDGDNPFDKAPATGNGAATKDNTGFAPDEEAGADPLGDKSGEIGEADLKALLKDYIGRFGDQGIPKLTKLLTEVGGVKRFPELPADKYAAVAAAARKEM